MSTTDTRAAFEKRFGPNDSFAWRDENDNYKVASLQSAWEVWQAATEAAKAAGTAGDQETHNFEICMHFDNWLISKGFASTSRTEVVDGPMAPVMNWIDAVEAAIEAARQPAPVAMSDEEILMMASQHGVESREFSDECVISLVRAALSAATNRSQP